MTSFNHEIEIEAPVEYVFNWGTEPENWQRSTPSLTNIQVLEETDEGTRFKNTFKMLGRSVESEEWYVVDEEEMKTVSTFDDEDGFTGEMTYEYVETEDGGTLVRLHGDIDTGNSLFDRAMRPIVSRYMNRQFRNTNKTMKELIELEYAEIEPDAAA